MPPARSRRLERRRLVARDAARHAKRGAHGFFVAGARSVGFRIKNPLQPKCCGSIGDRTNARVVAVINGSRADMMLQEIAGVHIVADQQFGGQIGISGQHRIANGTVFSRNVA